MFGYDEYYSKGTLKEYVLHIEADVLIIFSVMVCVFIHDIKDEDAENENEKTLPTPTDSLVAVMTHQIRSFGSL